MFLLQCPQHPASLQPSLLLLTLILSQKKREPDMCVSHVFFKKKKILDGLCSRAGGPDYVSVFSKPLAVFWDKAVSTANTSDTYQSSSPPPSTWLHMPFPGWQDKLYGWEIKAFGIVLSQNHSVIRCLLPYRRLTFYLWSKMWFYCQTQLVVPRRVLQRWEKWHLLKGRDGDCDERVAKWQLSVSAKALEFNLCVKMYNRWWIIFFVSPSYASFIKCYSAIQ